MEEVETIKAERDALEQDLKVQQDDMGECFLCAPISFQNWNSTRGHPERKQKAFQFDIAAGCGLM